MRGSAGEKGAVCMGKHTSTCKNMFPLRNASWTQGKTSSQAAQGCRISSLPRGRECVSVICGRRGLPGETVLHLTCATGDTHASPGREGWGQGRGAVISSLLPRHHPASSGGQGSLFVNTPLPGSPGGGRREEVGEGMREQDSGAQIPTEIL